MKNLVKISIIISSSLTFLAQADCGPVNLTDPNYLRSKGKEDLIAHFNKTRDQDSVGWCAAFSSSDAITYALGEPVSALDMTINFHGNKDDANETNDDKVAKQGMVIRDVVKNVKENGYCPESAIASDQTYSSNLGGFTVNQFLNYFQEYVNKTNKGTGYIDNCATCTEAYLNKYIKPRVPGATMDVVNEVIRKNNGDGLASLKELMVKACGDKRKTSAPLDIDSEYSGPAPKYFAKIQDALDGDAMPTIVLNTHAFANDGAVSGGHGLHAMVVTAKRMGANGKCEYQIRNSWGRSCSFYNNEVKKTCDERSGSFWLTEDQMAPTIAEVTVVKKKSGSNGRISVTRDDSRSNNNTIRENNTNNTNNTNNSNNVINTNNDSSNVNQLNSIGNSIGSFFQNLFSGIGDFLTNFWQSISKSFSY